MTEQEKTFEESVVAKVTTGLGEVLKAHPELRSVGVVFDWAGDLNKGAAPGVWMTGGTQPTKMSLPAVLGSLSQTVKLLNTQAKAATDLNVDIHRSIQQNLQMLKGAEDKVDAQEKERKAANQPSNQTRGGDVPKSDPQGSGD